MDNDKPISTNPSNVNVRQNAGTAREPSTETAAEKAAKLLKNFDPLFVDTRASSSDGEPWKPLTKIVEVLKERGELGDGLLSTDADEEVDDADPFGLLAESEDSTSRPGDIFRDSEPRVAQIYQPAKTKIPSW